MRVLGIDTSQPAGHVAVLTDGGLARTAALSHPSSHLVELGRAVERLLADEGIAARDLDRVALVSGPGSFTGLRIGMAYAKGLHAGLGTEIVVMTSLELLAVQASRDDLPVAPMIDARKDEVYAALYAPAVRAAGDSQEPRGVREVLAAVAADPAAYLASLDDRRTIFVGSGAVRYKGRIEATFGENAVFAADADHVPSIGLLCDIARGLTPLDPGEATVLEPFYVRSSGARLQPLRRMSAND
ncbi:MAG: tRNA (adenosine(37)-N6)-threonylcarbamoyltransferase complex dimerization subunit type 1 TsaB [bacterium]